MSRDEILTLLRTDPEIRAEVNHLILESAVMQELRALRADMNQRFEAVDRRFETLVNEMREGFRRMDDRFSALGSRWGIQTEEAVRAFAREFVGREFGVQAERWTGAEAELDVVVRNGKDYVIEVKASCDERDVERFVSHASAYEQATGRRPARRLIVTAHATGRAWGRARDQGVEIISG
jgi:hypothetical protein